MSRRRACAAALLGLTLSALLGLPRGAAAQSADPPTRVARVAYAQGSVSLQPGGTPDWVALPLNRPLTTGDQLWCDQDGRAELQLDGSLLRISSSTSLSLLNLGNEVTQIQLTSGTLIVNVRRLDDRETYEVDTPNLAFSVLRPGVYRISVDESGTTTSIRVRSGQGEVSGGGAAYSVRAGESDVFSGTEQLAEAVQSYPAEPDAFEAWGAERDRRWQSAESARYVSADVVGYQDLDANGEWRATPEYGYVWYPRGVAPGWAPYRLGHWAYIAPWGYTWVDDQPWGFAPFHYGRWVWWQGAWGWVPAPPAAGLQYVRPVYAPALVAWVAVGAGVAWFALAPREVYVPSYPVSEEYVRNVNVSNTIVNTTVVNNIYNTTIINNKTVNLTQVNYLNRNVPGAVTATTARAFSSAQPVSKNLLAVNAQQARSAEVRALAPALVPTKQAVLGAARPAQARPPARLEARPVVARTAPPPPPPPFERRAAAIEANGGKPLSASQVRDIQPPTAPRPAQVRLAPPAMPLHGEKVAPPPAPPPSAPRSPAVHPNELPAPPKPASPAQANSALERQQLQHQLDLQAQHAQERQRVQEQQDLEHRQLAAQADAARRAALERQHQQQTEQLQQKHQQEMQHTQAQQEAERRALAAQAAARKNEPPPVNKKPP